MKYLLLLLLALLASCQQHGLAPDHFHLFASDGSSDGTGTLGKRPTSSDSEVQSLTIGWTWDLNRPADVEHQAREEAYLQRLYAERAPGAVTCAAEQPHEPAPVAPVPACAERAGEPAPATQAEPADLREPAAVPEQRASPSGCSLVLAAALVVALFVAVVVLLALARARADLALLRAGREEYADGDE